MKSAAIHYY